MQQNLKIAVLGLGYVGLPLMLALSKKFNVIGFDTSLKRIRELKSLGLEKKLRVKVRLLNVLDLQLH